MRWGVLLGALTLGAAEPGYLDPATCTPCHAEIAASYAKTGMGRSFGRANDVPALTQFDHAASRQRFRVAARSGEWFLERQPFGDERRMDYAIGSGNHSRTFVYRNDAGLLMELPVSWYAEGGGKWRMSPGYDRADHSGFQREAGDACLFCHNGYPSAANGGLAQGIDCQRCHGPGEQHVRERGPIVNPAKLSRERRLDVCLQCHMESASRTLPEAVRRPGRGVFSYRPGEPLGDYMTFYAFTEGGGEDRMTVNGAGYGLLQSACFQRSAMDCVTCHNPHKRQAGDAAHFTQVCRSCHSNTHEPARDKCIDCHMPKRRTEDAVHVVMTDHRIRRTLPAGDPLAMLPERHDRRSGPVRLLYPATLPDNAETRLWRAMAWGDGKALAAAVAEARPKAAEPYFALGEAMRKEGRKKEAVEAYRRAGDAGALALAAELLLTWGNTAGAAALLEPAVRRQPDDTRLLNSLAVAYVARMQVREAMALLTRAVTLRAEEPISWLNLGVCREAGGDKAGAAAAYRTALRLQPELARARQFLERVTR
ncbi:MAG TPA: tetratricopeptide repeat protein [Bryobacteraceae bacterium]|nr:tetratricopeptide repeat protein [Bryobacteraceae bacterium]